MLDKLKKLIQNKIPTNYFGQGDYIYVEAEDWLLNKKNYKGMYKTDIGYVYKHSDRREWLELPDAVYEALITEIKDFHKSVDDRIVAK